MTEAMLNVLPGCLGSFVFGAGLVIWIVEMVLSARWHKKYFTTGVPIFAFSFPVRSHHTVFPSCLLLENNFKSSGLVRNTSLLFKELEYGSIGFRESLLQFGRWYSVMHGLLIFDEKNSQVIVKGFFDWIFLYFILLWLVVGPLSLFLGFVPLDESIWMVAIGYFGILFIIVSLFGLMDYFRFLMVARFAAQMWARESEIPQR